MELDKENCNIPDCIAIFPLRDTKSVDVTYNNAVTDVN